MNKYFSPKVQYETIDYELADYGQSGDSGTLAYFDETFIIPDDGAVYDTAL